MTPDFTSDRRYQVEQYVGRELTPAELVTVASVSDLAAPQREILDRLAHRHRLVAMIYLCGVVEGLLSAEAIAIIDHIRSKAGH